MTIPESTKTSLTQRLDQRARVRWSQITDLTVRCRAGFAQVDVTLPDGTMRKLCRLRYTRGWPVWPGRSDQADPAAWTGPR